MHVQQNIKKGTEGAKVSDITHIFCYFFHEGLCSDRFLH